VLFRLSTALARYPARRPWRVDDGRAGHRRQNCRL